MVDKTVLAAHRLFWLGSRLDTLFGIKIGFSWVWNLSDDSLVASAMSVEKFELGTEPFECWLSDLFLLLTTDNVIS